jgi:hypothetical protein
MTTAQLITTTQTTLTQVKSPALPFAPVQYDQHYQDQLNNILRLYFSQIDALVSQLNLSGVYTVATLPTAAAAGVGARAFVTDSSVTTFGTTVASGGSAKVPVYSDGTNWKVG